MGDRNARPGGGQTVGQATAALRWLGAPVTLLSLVVLAVNDHVLKQAWPGVVTGKLSDVAGLLVAPPLLALVLALLRVPRAATVSLAATGLGFALAKATETGVETANAVWSAVGWPTLMLRDATDLVALPILAVAAWSARSAQRLASGHRRVWLAAGSLALPFAVVATAATSPCHPPDGIARVGVVRGDFTGPPSGEQDRIVVSVHSALHSIDAQGLLLRVHPVDSARVTDSGPRLSMACSRVEARRCWRREDGSREPRVESSTDGGTTWSSDYRMPDDELATVRAEAGEGCQGDPPPVAVSDIAVLDTPRGPLVAVAAGNAGLLVRSTDGGWSRLSEEDFSRRSGTPPTPEPETLFTPLDQEPTRTPDPSSTALPPAPPRPTPPCPRTTLVTVTPDPRNGPPQTREVCVST